MGRIGHGPVAGPALGRFDPGRVTTWPGVVLVAVPFPALLAMEVVVVVVLGGIVVTDVDVVGSALVAVVDGSVVVGEVVPETPVVDGLVSTAGAPVVVVVVDTGRG